MSSSYYLFFHLFHLLTYRQRKRKIEKLKELLLAANIHIITVGISFFYFLSSQFHFDCQAMSTP